MFERFTERARQVVVLAQDEARNLRHDYIGTEHMLLGLLRLGEGPAVELLESHGVELAAVRGRVGQIPGKGLPPTGMIAFTPLAKRALEHAGVEALALGHRWVAPEHLLLGLVFEGEGFAAGIAREHRIDIDAVLESALSAGAEEERVVSTFAALRSSVRRAKHLAIEAQLFELASSLREIERKLD